MTAEWPPCDRAWSSGGATTLRVWVVPSFAPPSLDPKQDSDSYCRARAVRPSHSSWLHGLLSLLHVIDCFLRSAAGIARPCRPLPTATRSLLPCRQNSKSTIPPS
ncbi:hypothetical protein PM082_012697 [Marasmius tenuissimus]|nr:hypothetical protein PM082_012697 [Marasmius tenuissimus]